VAEQADENARPMRSGAPERPLVSAIIAACDEARFIENTVKSVLSQRVDGFELEVLVVNNGSTDNTPAIVANLAAADSRLKLFDNPGRSTPAAFNTGVRNARGEYICILGAHALYPPEYISVCVAEMRRWGAVACSGKILTVPANSSWQAQVCAWAMAHPFCSSGSSVRTQRVGFADTIPFPVIRRNAVLEVGGYDETLLRNQDNDMNQKLRAGGNKLFLTDKVQCRYYARSSVTELWRWGFGSGRWNAISLKRNPISLRPRHLVPLIFVSSLLSLVAIALVGTAAGSSSTAIVVALSLACLAVGGHLVLGSFVGVQVAVRKKSVRGLCLPVVILGFHLAYGWGTLVGLFASEEASRADMRQRGVQRQSACD
jgi:succinoglycan biosynthesis protein ExoA